MRGAIAGVVGTAIVAGVVLGLTATPGSTAPGTPAAGSPAAGSPAAGSPAAGSTTPGSAPSGPPPSSVAADPSSGSCVDLAALVGAYAADQGGDARSVVRPETVRCAGPYATAEVDDPSLPDPLNVLFSVAPVEKLRTGTGPVCEVGSGEGGLPPITAAQGAVLNCA